MLFFVLLGLVLIVLGVVLHFGGELFSATGQLLRKAGGDIDPEKGSRASWLGALLILAGCATIYLTMTLSK